MSANQNPWRTLTTAIVYDNPWMRVEEHQVINPSGGENLYGKVCFKNRAVAIIAVDDEDRIILVGQHRYTLDEYSWELPMGGAPLAEPALEAAKRELQEETGFTADRWRKLMHMHPSNSITDEVAIVFVANDLTPGEQQFEETEDLETRVLTLTEALEWVMQNRITDAVSAAGILRYWIERDRG